MFVAFAEQDNHPAIKHEEGMSLVTRDCPESLASYKRKEQHLRPNNTELGPGTPQAVVVV